VRLAEQAYAKTKRDDFLGTVGGGLYRAGQFKQALERLKEAKTDADIVGDLFRAMTHHRLGQIEEASTWLKKTMPLIDAISQARKQQSMGKTGEARKWLEKANIKEYREVYRQEVQEYQLLKREAEALIKGGAK
jgi:hypothetical protein